MKLQTCPDSCQLQRLVDGELDEHTEAIVEEHLSACESCRSQMDQWIQSTEWWQQARSSLQQPQNETTGDEAEIGCLDVLSLLGPTDDPDRIGRVAEYEVIGIIGRGGMGVVFKAFDPRLNRFVAIKMLLPHLATSGAAKKRFAREGQAAAAVVDDYVLPIYAVAEWQGVPYLVTQYLRGTTLQKRVQTQGPLELKEILRLGMQTARGLAAAHAQGLVHRDVKPSNILLDGSVERAMLTDFGLARAVDDASITRTGIIAGTPQYMSPEQARGGSVDARSDLFSLGCVLYFLCTGRPSFRADNSYAILRLITDEEPRSIREINPDIPEWLCVVVQKLMAKKAEDRHGSASEVAELLETCLAHVQQPTVVSLPENLLKKNESAAILPRFRQKAAGMLGIITLLTGLCLFLMPDEQPLIPRPAPPARSIADFAQTPVVPVASLEFPAADSRIVTVFPGANHLKTDLKTLVDLTSRTERQQWRNVEGYIDTFFKGLDCDRPVEIQSSIGGAGTSWFWVPLLIEKTPFKGFRENLDSFGYRVAGVKGNRSLYTVTGDPALFEQGWIRLDSNALLACVGITNQKARLDLLRQAVLEAAPPVTEVDGSLVFSITNTDHTAEAQEYRRRAFQDYRQQSMKEMAAKNRTDIIPAKIRELLMTNWLDEYQLLTAEGSAIFARVNLDREQENKPQATANLSATAIPKTALANSMAQLAKHKDTFVSVAQSESSVLSLRMNAPIADLRKRNLQSLADLLADELLFRLIRIEAQDNENQAAATQFTEGAVQLVKAAIDAGQFNAFVEGSVRNDEPQWIGALVVPNAESSADTLNLIAKIEPGNAVQLNLKKFKGVSIHSVALAGESLSLVQTFFRTDGKFLIGIESNRIWFAAGDNALESLVSQIETLGEPGASSSAFHLNTRLSSVISTLMNVPENDSPSASSSVRLCHEFLRNASRSFFADDDSLTIDVNCAGDRIDASVICDTGILRMLGRQLAKFSKENLE